jgi:hypothetical protein
VEASTPQDGIVVLMSFGFVEIDYLIGGVEGDNTPVRGAQVGRFAVRHATEEQPEAHSKRVPRIEDAPWRVDHIPTGAIVWAFDNFETAYAVADDLSRFSSKDPSSKDREKAMQQMGTNIGAWMRDVIAHGYKPYREWLVENKGVLWKPKRRKLKSLFGN